MVVLEVCVLVAMAAALVHSRRIGQWFTAERGTAPGQNGWV